jgi:hypothetical protein
MTQHVSSTATRLVAGILAALVLAGVAEALDLRSWDQQIPANKRFVVLTDFDGEAVLDKETQLVWQRQPNIKPFFTRDDAAGIGGDEDGCLHVRTGGRHGWRLPSIHELNSLLVDRVLPAGHPFLNVQTGFDDAYW